MIMLVLGGYPFSISTSAYKELVHARSWQWMENEVIDQAPDLQFTGAKAEVISLKGTMHPGFKGGALQMNALATMAGRGLPMLLVSGLGLIMGFWVIESIDENKFDMTSVGQAQKIEFNIALKKFGNMQKAIASLKSNPVSAVGGAIGSAVASAMLPSNLGFISAGL